MSEQTLSPTEYRIRCIDCNGWPLEGSLEPVSAAGVAAPGRKDRGAVGRPCVGIE